MKSIQDALARKEITPEEAFELSESPARHISLTTLDDLKVDTFLTPWPSFDELMILNRGESDLIVVGACPSVGKSAFIFQLAAHIAQTDNVVVFSLEMSTKSIQTRLLSQYAKKNMEDIKSGYVDKEELRPFKKKIDELNIYIDERGGLDVSNIYNVCVNYSKRFKIGLVVVDYLQLVRVDSNKSRVEEIGNVTKKLKELAKVLKCPIILASQLNREPVKRGKETGDYTPALIDLKDSGCIEADSDVIFFLNRHVVFEPKKCSEARSKEAEFTVAKSRNGITGFFILNWIGGWAKFTDSRPRKEKKHGKESKIKEESNQDQELVKVVNKALVWGKSKPKDLNGAIPLDLDIPPLVGDCYDDI